MTSILVGYDSQRHQVYCCYSVIRTMSHEYTEMSMQAPRAVEMYIVRLETKRTIQAMTLVSNAMRI